VRIEWVYDTNAATNFTTLHKKAGSCSKSNKFLLFSRYFRSLIGKLFLFYKIPIWALPSCFYCILYQNSISFWYTSLKKRTTLDEGIKMW
ncbi:MAG: hypothetical protein IIU63_05460, partial [Clostridia bacterium]|nr:hypothetical protein [Clostridia bacterium]